MPWQGNKEALIYLADALGFDLHCSYPDVPEHPSGHPETRKRSNLFLLRLMVSFFFLYPFGCIIFYEAPILSAIWEGFVLFCFCPVLSPKPYICLPTSLTCTIAVTSIKNEHCNR